MENIERPNTSEINTLLAEIESALTWLKDYDPRENKEDIYLTGKELKMKFHISSRALQIYRDKGKIPFYRLEGKILYRISDMNKLLQDNYYPAWD